MDPASQSSQSIPEPDPLPAPLPDPAPAPSADLTQPYANRVINQGTEVEQFFCGPTPSASCINPMDGTRRPHINSDPVPAEISAACGSSNIFYKELPWIDAAGGTGQFGVVINSVGNDQIVVFHTVVPHDQALVTNLLKFTMAEFASGSPPVNDRQFDLSGTPCNFRSPPPGGSEGTALYAGIHSPTPPPPYYYNEDFQRGEHIYFSVSGNKNPSYVCEVDATCAVILQVAYYLQK